MSVSHDVPPKVVGGRYTLGELIGRGGAAEVYRAHDELLGREVAIKMFTAGPEVGPGATGEAAPPTGTAAVADPLASVGNDSAPLVEVPALDGAGAAEPGVGGTGESVSPAPAPTPGEAPEYQGTPGVPVPGNDQPTDLPSDAPGHQGEID